MVALTNQQKSVLPSLSACPKKSITKISFSNTLKNVKFALIHVNNTEITIPYTIEIPLLRTQEKTTSQIINSQANIQISLATYDSKLIEEIKNTLSIGYKIHGNEAAEFKYSTFNVDQYTLPFIVKYNDGNGHERILLTLTVKIIMPNKAIIPGQPSGLEILNAKDLLDLKYGCTDNNPIIELTNLTVLTSDGRVGINGTSLEIDMIKKAFYGIAYMLIQNLKIIFPFKDLKDMHMFAIVQKDISRLLCSIIKVPLELVATPDKIQLTYKDLSYYNAEHYWGAEMDSFSNLKTSKIAIIGNKYNNFVSITEQFFNPQDF